MKSSATGGTVSNHGALYFRHCGNRSEGTLARRCRAISHTQGPGVAHETGCAIVNGLVHKMNTQVIPLTEERHDSAVEAFFLEFGKGRHAVAFSFGDARTDITAA